tara:strand:- start:6556 stop:15735 length:9180 start_codon:yes stop_codon:yes gene_type:complete
MANSKYHPSDSTRAIWDSPIEGLDKYVDTFNSLEDEAPSGNIYEFLGQATWGATEALTLGAATIADVAREEIAKKQVAEGTLNSSELQGETRHLERKFTSLGGLLPESYEGEFGDLSLWGQVGYTLGSILGTIPTFVVGGALTSKAITATSKIGGVGTRVVSAKAGKDIQKAFVDKIKTNVTDDLVRKNFGDDAFEQIATLGIKEVGQDSQAAALRQFGNEVFETTAKSEIGKHVNSITGLAGETLENFSDEVFKIVTQNNPNDAQRILFGLGAKAFPNSPKIGLVAGAMGYDALLGMTIGVMRGSAVESVKANLGYDIPDDKEDTYASRILGTTLHESAILSVLGPVKFIRGGSQGSMLRKTKDVMYGMVKNLTPARKLSKSQLEAQISIMDMIGGSEVTKKTVDKLVRKYPGKFDKMNRDEWWKNASSSEMVTFINEARKDFLMNAPGLWMREFGAEMIYSLPRMAMGTLAMNAQGVYDVVKNYGIENVEMAFGATPEERISNIFTAMFFTRKAHSFHTGTKMMGFETGDIRNYASLKGEMLGKTIGNLKAIGTSDFKALNDLASAYHTSAGKSKGSVDPDTITNHAIESSAELRTIRDISERHGRIERDRPPNTEVHGFQEAATRYMIETFGDKNVDAKNKFRDDIVRADTILDFYKQISFTGDSLLLKTFTPQEAGEIVNQMSQLKFGNKSLDPSNPYKALKDWHEEVIMKSSIEPVNVIKQFVSNSYEALLAAGFQEKDGVLELPKMDKLSIMTNDRGVSRDADHALKSAVDKLVKVGKIRLTDEVTQFDRITDSQRETVINNYRQGVDSLHKWLYGDDFNPTSDSRFDADIMSNYSWYDPYLRIKERNQVQNAVAVLTGSGRHTLDTRDYDALRTEINNLISSKSKIEKFEGEKNVDIAELQDVLKFVQSLHGYYGAVNKRGGETTPIDYEQAKTLKANVESMLGSVFTHYEAKGELSRALVDNALEKVNLADSKSPHNMKTAFLHLMHHETFAESEVTRIPSVESFNAVLASVNKQKTGMTKEASDKHFSDIKSFYKDLTTIVEEANPNNIVIDRSLSYESQNSWYDAILDIKRQAGRDYIDTAQNRVSAILRSSEAAKNKIDMLQIEMNIGFESLIARRKDTKTMDEIKNASEILDQNAFEIKSIVSQIKEAHQGRNRHLLHAILSREKDLSSNIDQILNAQSEGRVAEYAQELVKIYKQVNQDALKNGYKEASVSDRIARELETISVPDRDMPAHSARISLTQFAMKYGMKPEDIIDLTYVDRGMVSNGENTRAVFEKMKSDIPNLSDAAIKKLDRLIGKIPDGDLAIKNFKNNVVAPLYELTLRKAMYMKNTFNKPYTLESIKSDINTVITATTSSKPIAEYKYSNGRLIANTKLMANTSDRGVNGIIERLSPGSESIVLLSNTNYSGVTGKIVNGFPDYFRHELDRNLSKSIPVESGTGLRDAVVKNKFESKNVAERFEDARFKMIELDESTVLLARVDVDSPLRSRIDYEFTNDNAKLKKDIDALGIGNHSIIKKLTNEITSGKSLDDAGVEMAVKVTRIILDAPHLFEKGNFRYDSDGGITTVEQAKIDKMWKYLKTAQPKNGFIGSEDNLARSNAQLEFLAEMARDGSGNALRGRAGHYHHLYERVKEWATPDKDGKYKKLKVLSVADETDFGKGYRNIFSSRARAEVILDKMVKDGKLSDTQRDYNLELIKKLKKSVADGEFILGENPYVSLLGMHGSGGRDFLKFDNNGNLIEARAGGIKPSVNHISIDTAEGRNYGRTRVFYAKTAFKYRPEFQSLLDALGVDAITFKSANKINEYKPALRAGWLNSDPDKLNNGVNSEHTTYANVKRIDKGSGEIGTNLVEWMSNPRNLVFYNGDMRNHVSEIPLSSINMFAIGVNHKPMVSQNIAVHMQSDNGVREWLGLHERMKTTSDTFNLNRDNLMYTTALARKIMGHTSELGDRSFVQSGLDQVMKYDGLITDPWMKKDIDDRIIPYLLNGGAIGAGRVDHGSYDVMSADFSGNLYNIQANDGMAISVRRKINPSDDVIAFGGDRKVLSNFGEFTASWDFAKQPFKLFGEGAGGQSEVGSVIVSNIDYQMKGKLRKNRDAFMVDDILVVEGIGIDKKGNFRDLNWVEKENKIKTEDADRIENKKYYKEFKDIQDRALALYDKDRGLNTFDQMALAIHNLNKTETRDVAIGVLNNRQPRNQAGDIVINRLKTWEFNEGADTWVVTSRGREDGNKSIMNFIDAIHAQDADFDMDKSMAFGASHHKFWKEAGRLAGYETAADVNLISELFTHYATDPANVSIWTSDSHKQKLNDINAARGRFVKMHQTMTYMANIFRNSDDASGSTKIMEFKQGVGDKTVTYEVRVNNFNAQYINTTEKVATAAKEFIDMYKDPPTGLAERINQLQWDIYFGKEGLFQIGTLDKNSNFIESKNYSIKDNVGIRETLIENFLTPINRYLTYNKGLSVDETAATSKATVDDYYTAYRNLLYSTDSRFVQSKYAGKKQDQVDVRDINITNGLDRVFTYFGKDAGRSGSSYDFAMREIYKLKTGQEPAMDEMLNTAQSVMRFVETGQAKGELTHDQYLNRITQRAFSEIVKDDAKVIEYGDLTGVLSNLEWKLNDMVKYDTKGKVRESAAYKEIEAKRDRAANLLQTVADALAYKLEPTEGFIEVFPRRSRNNALKKGRYTNTTNKVVVVREGFGDKNIKEIIPVGGKNKEVIRPKDIMLSNGKRYEMVKGDSHLALEMADNMFNTVGGWNYVSRNGEKVHLNPSETAWLRAEVMNFNDKVKNAWNNRADKSKYSLEEYALTRLDLLNELFSHPKISDSTNLGRAYQEALVAIMMTPGHDRNVITIAPYKGIAGSGAKLGVKFYENKNSKLIYQYLSQVSESSIVDAPITSQQASRIIENVTTLKKLGMYEMWNGQTSHHADWQTRRSHIPSYDYLEGHIARDNQVGMGVFETLRTGDANARRSAELLIDYASGKTMLDPGTLYKASKFLERSVPVTEQFVNTRYIEGAGLMGVGKRVNSSLDRGQKRNFGDKSNVNESVGEYVKKSLGCFKK